MTHSGNLLNIISDKLPDTVAVSGKEYAVKTDFREWINYFIIHENEEIYSSEKILLSLSLYSGSIPENLLNAYEALQSFASCDRMPRNNGTGKKSGAGKAPVFSYLYDSAYIFSDFLRHYNINLQTADMHWYTFIALLDGLPQDSEVKQRIAYRSVDPYEIKDKKRREQILIIQRSIGIPHENISAAEIGSRLW
ncbi:MAG: Gp15 family bacteriophage protein [Ruminococcus sp.]